MRPWISAGAALCVFAGFAFSQLQFDVASVRVSNPDNGTFESLYTDHSGSLHTENYPLRGIILSLTIFATSSYWMRPAGSTLRGMTSLRKPTPVKQATISFVNDCGRCWPTDSHYACITKRESSRPTP
jgi:hypothetical protein